MRLFVAVLVPESLTGPLVASRRRLERRFSGGRWTDPARFHATLKFLGEVADDRVAAVETALGEAVAGVPPFTVELAGAGTFPSGHAPRVVWAGVREGRLALEALAARVETAFARLGFPPERNAYRAHVTLGRLSPASRRRGPDDVFRDLPPIFGSWRADAVCLMESDLRPSGAVHTVRRRYNLAETGGTS